MVSPRSPTATRRQRSNSRRSEPAVDDSALHRVQCPHFSPPPPGPPLGPPPPAALPPPVLPDSRPSSRSRSKGAARSVKRPSRHASPGARGREGRPHGSWDAPPRPPPAAAAADAAAAEPAEAAGATSSSGAPSGPFREAFREEVLGLGLGSGFRAVATAPGLKETYARKPPQALEPPPLPLLLPLLRLAHWLAICRRRPRRSIGPRWPR